MTKDEAEKGLQVIEAIRGHVDYGNLSAASKAKLDGKAQGYLASMRNLARASIENDIGDLRRKGDEGAARTMDIAGENIRPFTNPEIEAVRADAPNRNLGRAAVEQDQARQNYNQAGVGMGGTSMRQAKGTGAAMAGTLSPLVPSVEAFGELASQANAQDFPEHRGAAEVLRPSAPGAFSVPLSSTQLRQMGRQMPHEGETARYVDESPSPLLAKAMAIGGALLTGRLGPVASATRLVERGLRSVPVVRRLAPRIAAPAAVGAGIGVTEAGIRRIPAALDPNREVAPLQAGEILAPAGASAAFAAAPAAYRAAHGWATNPMTETGIQATRWAGNQRSGVNRALERRYAKGNIGMTQMDEQLGRELDTVKRDAKVGADIEMESASQPIKARTREEIASAEAARKRQAGENVMAKGRVAAEVFPDVNEKLTRYRIQTNDELVDATAAAVARDSEFGPRFRNDHFLADIRDIVGREAKPGTAGTSNEIQTPLGQQYAAIEREALKYLGPQQTSTVAQVKNFIKYLKAQADSGTPERAFPANSILWAARKRLGEADPELAKAHDIWKRRTSELERVRRRMMGSDDMHRQGVDDPQSELDAPEAGAPFNPKPTDPKEVEAARRYLMSQRDMTPSQAVRAPDRAANEDAGFRGELETVDRRLSEIDDAELAQSRRFDEEAALRREAEQRELAAARRGIDERAGTTVRSAEDRALETIKDKEALELARFPGTRKLMRPALRGAITMSYKSPAHTVAGLGETGLSITQAASIPIAARMALRPPTLGQALRMPGLENTVPIAVAATRPKAPKEDQDDKALGQLPPGRVSAESIATPADAQKLLKRQRRPRTSEGISQALIDRSRSVYGHAGRLTAPMASFFK